MSERPGSHNQSGFDRYADEYQALVSQAAALAGEDALYFAGYKLKCIRRVYDRSPPPVHVMDIGCGVGLLTELLARTWPATQVSGLDVSLRSLEQAASRCAGLRNIVWCHFNGTTLPAQAEQADLIVIANVLHHVETTARQGFLEKIVLPALSPTGRVVIFEHNPYNPVTRLVVRLCPFDRDAHLVSRRAVTALLRPYGLQVIRWDYIVFFPRILNVLRGLERRMGWFPLGAQYMVVAQRQACREL
jgi:SAM-dependent methyltransferase